MTDDNLKAIQDFCRRKHIDPGEMVLVIKKIYGQVPAALPDFKKDEIENWLQENWFRFYAILEPEKHALIMQMTDENARQYQLFYESRGESGRRFKRIENREYENWTK
jgi:hypothetical protein